MIGDVIIVSTSALHVLVVMWLHHCFGPAVTMSALLLALLAGLAIVAQARGHGRRLTWRNISLTFTMALYLSALGVSSALWLGGRVLGDGGSALLAALAVPILAATLRRLGLAPELLQCMLRFVQ